MKYLNLKSISKVVFFLGIVIFATSCQRGYGCPYDFSVVVDFLRALISF
ncbi:MAG TPA: hypothetical protein PLU49_03100 [Saprospiraceae bacterium]|nr:hypothetical protein [Saprospiraceae bacterium]